MKYDVVLTDTARRQLDEACAWYASRDSRVADEWYNGFINALISLENNPQQHGPARENDTFPVELRQFLYGSGHKKTHRAVFAIRPGKVVVHSIRHLAQRDVMPGDL